MFLQSKDKAFHVWQTVTVKVLLYSFSFLLWTNQVEITVTMVQLWQGAHATTEKVIVLTREKTCMHG